MKNVCASTLLFESYDCVDGSESSSAQCGTTAPVSYSRRTVGEVGETEISMW
jgi:hypothetical protein